MIKLLPAQLLGRAFQPGSDRTAFLRAELLKLVQAIGVVGVFHEFVGELSIVRSLASAALCAPLFQSAPNYLSKSVSAVSCVRPEPRGAGDRAEHASHTQRGTRLAGCGESVSVAQSH
jgi:hypothetical protein